MNNAAKPQQFIPPLEGANLLRIYNSASKSGGGLSALFLNSTLILFFSLAIISCKNENVAISEATTPATYHKTVKALTDVIVHDIFSPPVASRNYVYPNIAAYECIVHASDYKTLAGQLTDFTSVPAPPEGQEIDFKISAVVAFYEVANELVFSGDQLAEVRAQMHKQTAKTTNKKVLKQSADYGKIVATHIKEWMGKDNYHQTRTFPKYSVNYKEDWRWQPTPPDYMEGIEPHWREIRTMVIDSAAQFKPIPHPVFSLEKNSLFYKELMEVMEVRNNMQNDEAEEMAIAKFWDCNPYVSTHKGHFMFAVKKITPGGHWIGITKEACEEVDADFATTVAAYTKTSIALFDAFISCWDEKYNSNLIRPETLINKHLDPDWKPVLQTPPFPEYTSGHSVISAAAATSLTTMFGNNLHFVDSTEVEYGLPPRAFNSFFEASEEAAISRLYGGIHYRAAIDNGVIQGKELGNFVVENLDMGDKSLTAEQEQ